MEYNQIDTHTRCSTFSSPKGAPEHFLMVSSSPGALINDSLKEIHERLTNAIKALSLSPDSLVFSRIYLSDIANQKESLFQSAVFSLVEKGCYSIIGQPPANLSPICLFCYLVSNGNSSISKKTFKRDPEIWMNAVKLSGKNYEMLYIGNLTSTESLSSQVQTSDIFSIYSSFLESHGQNLLHNGLRTWIYVRDIDNHYNGMVDARREHFTKNGLKKETRYIASTGIEGKSKEVGSLVHMDALSFSEIQKEQIIKMEAPEYMCPTINYNVTFERGTRILFGDRSHMYISGTASIDKNGDILHPNNPIFQTKRAVQNMESLLKAQGADFSCIAYLIIYLRDFSHQQAVLDLVKNIFGANIPMLQLSASACRPGWLVEIEGVAIKKEKNDFSNFL